MPSFSDSIFLFVLALLLFGPKRLPVLARELGKWIGEFRRASNEFKLQMDEELRASEQADRQKQIAAMEAAAPPTAPIPEPEHPHLTVVAAETEAHATAEPATLVVSPVDQAVNGAPLPIATAGSLNLMPPSTGLPTARSREPRLGQHSTNPLDGLMGSIPLAPEPASPDDAGNREPSVQETATHG